ncbi:MAG: hypothetical protein ACE37F_31555 [Nannocystaceae bacterium]|nr:hypothetical protein [bacterium]
MRRFVWGAVALVSAACDPASASPGETDTDAGTSASAEVSTGAGASTGPGNVFDQTLACQSWLECLDDNAAEQLSAQYGPGGSCWTQTVSIVEMCDADCVQGYNAECVGGGSHGSGAETTGPTPDIDECDLQMLAPGAESLVEAGDMPALIPTEIGTVLERVCSCHVADLEAFVPDAPLYYGNARFYTYDQMHAFFEGAAMYVEVGIRALDELNMPPTYYCGEGEYGSLNADEYEILQAWVEAEAPDGAQWLRVRPEDLPPLD